MPWGRYMTVKDGLIHFAIRRRGSIRATLRCEYHTGYGLLLDSDVDTASKHPITCLWCLSS